MNEAPVLVARGLFNSLRKELVAAPFFLAFDLYFIVRVQGMLRVFQEHSSRGQSGGVQQQIGVQSTFNPSSRHLIVMSCAVVSFRRFDASWCGRGVVLSCCCVVASSCHCVAVALDDSHG